MSVDNFPYLNTENIESYYNKFLKEKLKGKLVDVLEENKHSNTNFVFRLLVLTNGKKRLFYLKQAQPYIKKSIETSSAVAVEPNRVKGEVKILDKLASIWVVGTVPKVLFYSPRHFCFVMDDIGVNGKILIDEFKRNKVHPEIGKKLGELLAQLHSQTWRNKEFSNLNIGFKRTLTRFLFKKHWAKGALRFINQGRVDDFFSDFEKPPFSVVWGDAVYRNIFVKPKGAVSMFDFDHVIKYNPMLDCGMLTSHWLWMWLKNNTVIKDEAEKFIVDFWFNYWRIWKKNKYFNKTLQNKFIKQAERWMGFYLLSRTDGSSGSYFSEYPAWESKIRQLGVDLFSQRDNVDTKKIKEIISRS